MINQNIRLVILFSVAIVLSVLMTSCRSVQKQKNEQFEKTTQLDEIKTSETVKEDLNINKQVEIEINSHTGIIEETVTYEPIDKDKPAYVINKQGKKIELNNSKLTEKKTVSNNKTASNEKSNIQINAKKEAAKQSEASQKAAAKKAADQLNIKRESGGWSVVFWLVIGLIVAIWLIWKYGRFPWLEKIKSKIWWV